MLSSLLNPAGADESERHKSLFSRLEMAVFGEEQREEGIAGVAQGQATRCYTEWTRASRARRSLWMAQAVLSLGSTQKSRCKPEQGHQVTRDARATHYPAGGTIADALPGGETGGAKGKVPGVEPISDAPGKIPGVGKAGKMGKVKGTSLNKGKR